MLFMETERPTANNRNLHENMPWDRDLETALLLTANTGKGVMVPLGMFHSSPAKGRLWAKGYSLRHRRFGEFVVAWVQFVGIPLRKKKETDNGNT